MSKFLIILTFVFTMVKDKQTLIVGDSLSANHTGWQSQLCTSKNFACTNLSIGGKTTKWMYNALQLELKTDSSYDQVIIYGGINDIFSGLKLDSAISNVQKMVNLSRKYNIKPIVILGYDPNEIIHNTWIKNKLQETVYRARYIEYQEKLNKITGAKIIPVAPLKASDAQDGIHLTTQGQSKFYQWVAKYF
jgi:lysophospholipase L1-like esterase